MLQTLISLLGLVMLTFGAPDEDTITYMPGLKEQPSWKQYSGYLNATGTKKLHYWFVESMNNPSEDPLLLWMNGGPGCSSMQGFLTENGPFRIEDNGINVTYNPYSWNKVANIIYLETPTGVGYSYSLDRNYTTDDDECSLDNFVALKNFYKKFPEFRKNDFYVTGESYAGIFVPLLSSRVVDDPDINFKGFVVGNGLFDDNIHIDSQIYYGYYHGLYGERLWNNLTQYCCGGNITMCSFVRNKQKTGCNEAIQAAMQIITGSGFDQYNIYSFCEGGAGIWFDRNINKTTFSYQLWNVKHNDYLNKKMRGIKEREDFANMRQIIPCVKYGPVSKYLNTEKVRKQLHVPDIVQPWEICSNEVHLQYKMQYTSVKDQFLKVLREQKRILIYNGDFDITCTFLGDEWFVDSLKQPIITERKAWHFVPDGASSKHVAGFVKVFKDITFLTVMGAGHLVPTDQPKSSLLMITTFLRNKPFE